MDHLVEVGISIAMMIVVEVVATVAMAVVADTMIAIVALLATMTVSVVLMGVVMIMDLVELIDMLQAAATIATAAVATNTAEGATPTAEMVDVLGATLVILQEIRVSLTVEVETKNTALTIGTPVVNFGPLIYSGAERSGR